MSYAFSMCSLGQPMFYNRTFHQVAVGLPSERPKWKVPPWQCKKERCMAGVPSEAGAAGN